jgi:hypothetical protein
VVERIVGSPDRVPAVIRLRDFSRSERLRYPAELDLRGVRAGGAGMAGLMRRVARHNSHLMFSSPCGCLRT